MGFLTKKAAIVGVAEFERRRAPDKTVFSIHAEMAKRALEDAGLTLKDVDGYFTSGDVGPLSEYMGLHPNYIDSTSVGGSSFVIHVGHAAAAIAAGMCNVALITYGSTNWSGGVSTGAAGRAARMPADNFEVPYGPTTIGSYALCAQRHAYQYGTTDAQRAEISVATRKWAALNPDAMFRTPLTLEDVVNSRVVSSPLHFLECCLISDGGGGVVLTSAERAKDLKHPPVYVLGESEYWSHSTMNQMADFTKNPAAGCGEKAFQMAGVDRKDIDIAMIYDSFTITVLMELEDLGFCAKGEGGAFVSGQRTAPGGAFPMNTDGGGLSSNHPGARGIFLVIEATRQLRHMFEGTPRQVPNAKIAIAHGTGGSMSSGGTAIRGRD
ncbi:MAG: thiolase [Dehalococcoidia bacterium]|nr:thiolase [Dehalococcoidia bacterium]